MKASHPVTPTTDGTPEIPPSPRWLAVSFIVVGFALTLTLLRYAIDLLAVAAFVWVLGRTVGRIADFFTGQQVSGWSLAGLLPTVVAAVLLLEMLGGPRLLMPHVERRVPSIVTRGIYWAKTNGWGQTALPLEPGHRPTMDHASTDGPGVDLPPATSETPRLPTLDATRRNAPEVDLESEAEAGRLGASATPVKTTTTLEVPGRVLPGGRIELTARVEARSGEVPQGEVEFRSGRTLLGTVKLDRKGRASLGVRRLPVGTHEITATFNGTPPFADSMSTAVQQVVGRE